MKTLVSASAHFALTPDGALWTPNSSLQYSFWTRYLSAYDEVHLLVQTKKCATPPAGWNKATGEGVVAAPVPDFLTPRLLVQNLGAVKKIVRQTLSQTEAVHLRVCCFLGNIVWRELEAGRPFGVEVVADPYDSYAPGALHHPARSFFRWWLPREMRNQCAAACAATYVTREALQRRYPPGPDAFSTYFSNVDLRGEFLVDAPRGAPDANKRFELVLVGTLAQMYKAPDVLIRAIEKCVREGLDLQLTLIGSGRHVEELEALAKSLGIGDRMIFRGQVFRRDEVKAELDAADLFMLPSRQEGLPRAMVEAMARALPCIGSTVGGIPELLPPEDLVPPGDVDALAKKISEVLRDPQRMKAMSARNLETAREYEEGLLRKRRDAFYDYVKNQTAAYFGSTPGRL
jgi:glycosyltransferase involved in cell wall biosynthesis